MDVEPSLKKNADARSLAAGTLVVALIEKLLETNRISQSDMQDVQKRAVAALPQNKFAAVDARDIIVESMGSVRLTTGGAVGRALQGNAAPSVASCARHPKSIIAEFRNPTSGMRSRMLIYP
jgi:hypothetical protein